MSQKMKPQLCYNGYCYRAGCPNKKYCNWRCCYKNCKATCITYGDSIGESYDVITENRCNDHIHAPNPLLFKLKEKRRKMHGIYCYYIDYDF